MAKIVPLAEPDLSWAKERFARYYRSATAEPPTDLPRREFAAFPFAQETVMRRHASLTTPAEFRAFLRETVPRHVYYSSAYYEHPDHPTMAAKEWLGADLIFDLDADHLRGSAPLGYADQLALVKKQLVRLYDDFLLGDFGVDPDHAAIVFSGGRGYHVHVRDPRFWRLISSERRELVDYLSGTEADVSDWILEARHRDDANPRARKFRQLAPADAPGWRGRTTRGLFELLHRWESKGAAVAEAELVRAGAEARAAKSIARFLVEQGGAARIREGLSLEAFPKKVPTELLEAVLRSAAVEMQGETDAPVTTDVHRLIRLPGSLHGGTGFRVVSLDRDGLDRFEPLRDAVIPGPDLPLTGVRLLEGVDYPFEPAVQGAPGEALDVAEVVALFLILRGEATLRP
ncbi:MAG: DNA primase small subunit PriS [Thermoplasmata archaeon]|nr:DNA primase small subunit PriS [Thermoplasmata archaeon]MCI4358989.1 DNA primase small subunit PriS [Thermoplasmata archaeon]